MVKSADIATFDTSDSWQERTIRKLNYNFMKLYELFSGSIPFATEAGHAPTNRWVLGCQTHSDNAAQSFSIPSDATEIMVVADINRNGAGYHHFISAVFPVSEITADVSQYDLGGYATSGGAGAWVQMSTTSFNGVNSYINGTQIGNTNWRVYVR